MGQKLRSILSHNEKQLNKVFRSVAPLPLLHRLPFHVSPATVPVFVPMEGLCGGAERNRTADPLLAKQMLSQLSYSPKKFPIYHLLLQHI
jgi:hypothetical protein